MQISLDTNIWIFGIVGADDYCENILFNLAQFEIIIPDQVRVELERNLNAQDMTLFYRLILQTEVKIDYEKVPLTYITEFEQKGLTKGDAEIGAYCKWREIDILVSDNRDFLKTLPANQCFQVISPKAFCEAFGLKEKF